MSNTSRKLKWWQKGALIGLGLGVINALFAGLVLLPISKAGGDAPNVVIPAFFFSVLNLPVLPILFSLGKVFGSLPFSDEVNFFLLILISWTLGGIVYAFIFHTLRRLIRT